MDSLKSLFTNRAKIVKPPKYEWQEQALEIIKQIPDSYKYKSSIFQCCRKDSYRAKLAANDCKELNKNYSLYFLKVFNSLGKIT